MTEITARSVSGASGTRTNKRAAFGRRKLATRHVVSRNQTIIYGLLGLILVLLLWQVGVWAGAVNPLVASSPAQVAQSFVTLVSNGVLLHALSSTSELFAIGFGISLLIGIPIGLVLGWYRRLNAVLDPVVSITYALPRIALIPLVIIWFGPGLAARITIVVLLAAFPILINVASGIAAVTEDHLRLAQSFLASNTDVLRTIALPGAVPAVISGIRQGLNLGLAGVVVAEYFVGDTGVGGLIFKAGLAFDTAEAIVGALVFAFAALILTILLQMLEHHFDRWRA